MISNTWARLYNVVESAEEKWRRECGRDGMGGEGCREWSAAGESRLEWGGGGVRGGGGTGGVVRVGDGGAGGGAGVGELRMLRFSLGVTGWAGSGVGTSEGRRGWEGLGRGLGRRVWDGVDACGGGMMGILGEGC